MLMGTGIIWKSSHVHWLRKRRDCCVCVVMEAIGNIGTYWKLQVYSEWALSLRDGGSGLHKLRTPFLIELVCK